jgi:hypothetical protein
MKNKCKALAERPGTIAEFWHHAVHDVGFGKIYP